MRLRLRFLGFTVCSLVWDSGPALELLEEEPQGITGGSSLYTERDLDAPNANHEEPWYEDRFGFG